VPTRVLLAFALGASLSLTASCGKTQEPDPLQLQGSRLTINNRTKDDWKDVQVVINRQYRIAAPAVVSGQRFDVSLDAFLDVYGNHFYYQRQQIRDVHLMAKTPGGMPVDMHMDFHRSGLQGLADVGVFKKKETQ
jgi:hypothetical protein